MNYELWIAGTYIIQGLSPIHPSVQLSSIQYPVSIIQWIQAQLDIGCWLLDIGYLHIQHIIQGLSLFPFIFLAQSRRGFREKNCIHWLFANLCGRKRLKTIIYNSGAVPNSFNRTLRLCGSAREKYTLYHPGSVPNSFIIKQKTVAYAAVFCLTGVSIT